MSHDNVTRRRLLRGVGAGVALGGMVGTAGAQEADDYIVGVRNRRGVEQARGRAESVKRVLDFDDIGKAVAGRFTQEALENLQRNPNVRYVEEDGEMHAIAQTLPWGIDRVDADVLHDKGETGNGADIAIIDTGIDSDHSDLQANLGTGKAFVNCRGPTCNERWDDDHDHGTHCAGIADAVDNIEGVVGVATEATLHAVKVLDSRGSGSYSDVAAGIEWTADQGYDVGSMSLGGGKSSTVEDACEYAYGKGVLLVAAAGNDGPCSNCVSYPAAEPEVIAVSATSKDDSLASFSSTGPEVELAAPGENVYSTVIGGYDTFSGTSMACPHVSGAGGQLMANEYTNEKARNQLNSTAEDIGLGDNEQGNGLLDAEAAILSDSVPSVSWVNPSDGDAVSGTVTIRIDASDSEDSDGSLDVTYNIDGGSSQTTSYNSTSGYYEGSWNTTEVSDGDHTIEAAATDSAGNTSSSTITVTADNTEYNPGIDQFSLTDDSNPAWTQYYVDWAVSDDDGDLADVTSEMVDSSETVLDSASSSVSGSSASGTHYLETKSSASDIVLTVTDEAGNSGSSSKSI